MNRKQYNFIEKFISYLEKSLYFFNLKSAKNLTLPDFLCIGAQKSGTTWLAENLQCHPQIYLPMRKKKRGLRYFDLNFYSTLDSYAQNFQEKYNRIQAQGEVVPDYSCIRIDRIKFIYKIMPKIKLIFLIRNPIDRAWSHAYMTLVSLKQRKYEDVKESEFYQHFQSKESLERGDYITILDNWLSVFPPSQLYIGFFEQITDSPKQIMTDIFNHLEVSTDVNWNNFSIQSRILPPRTANKDMSHINHSRITPPMPSEYRDFLMALEELFGND